MTFKSLARGLLVFGFMAQINLVAADKSHGTIRGDVRGTDGRPIAGARVNAVAKDGRTRRSIVRYVETNTNGEFEILGLSWGTYSVFAVKESDGYPNTNLAFYSSNSFPIVNLGTSTPTATVSIRLGPKAGKLSLPVVVDAETHKSVLRQAWITLRRAEHPEYFITTSAANAEILVPSEVDVIVEVGADGYSSWPREGQKVIRVAPGESSKLDVELNPK